MKKRHSKKMLLLLFSVIGLLASCAKGGSDSGSNSNNSNNSNSSGNNTPPPATTASYTVSLFAGSQTGAVDGTGANAGFKSPRAMTMDQAGNLFVVDPLVNEIREVTPSAVVTTFATSSNFTNLSAPLIVDPSDNVYIAETNFYKVAPGGGTPTVLNLGVANVSAMTVDASGNTYLCASGVMHKITSSGVISVFAGSGQGTVTDGTGTTASFSSVSAMAADASGNIYAADVNNGKCVIRKMSPAGVVTSITLTPTIYVQPTVTYANAPIGGIGIDGSGNIYATETQGNLILEITQAGAVTTIAGNGGTTPNNGPAASAGFYYPIGIAVNSTGKLIYVADSENKTIRKITTP